MGQKLRTDLIAIVFTALSVTSVHALTYGDAEFTCPIGGEVFTTQVVGSYTRLGMRLDLKPLGALVAPLPVPVCPGNGFVMYKDEFSDEELAKLTPIVESDAYQEARTLHTDYYMLAFLLEELEMEALDLAHIYLKATWEAEEQKPELLADYQSLALGKFKAYLDTEPDKDDNWWIAQIVSANLERRTGQHAEAIARIEALPLDQNEAREKFGEFINQIKQWAMKQESSPQVFQRKK